MTVGNVEGTVETPPLDLFTSREKSHIHKIDRQREVFSPLRAGYTTATKVYGLLCCGPPKYCAAHSIYLFFR